ncbi:allantoinase AllB [Allokutzneria sp. NRRL B-24872]|uniref:allantoinase AllB n=1 Tax=Allokutzneria sp. NRRL B-24872 TaxID=1137961 RepID=UPI000A371203|nr:allantoinase AllB [Allokutzneria sp. NRRL B-24872]
MTAYDLVVRSRCTHLPDSVRPAAVCARDGRIAEIADYESTVDSPVEVDLADLALLPGLVDSHVHINEPGRTEWEGFATATRAAAAGGVTTLIDMPLNSLPPTVDAAALATKRAAAQGKCYVDVGFWGGAIPGNTHHLAELHEAGVFGFKCFTSPSGVDEFPPLSWAELPDVLAELRRMDALLIVHAEDPAELAEAPDSDEYAGFLASRPPRAEDKAIARLAGLAERARARVHVLHLSSASALGEIRSSTLSAESCPHYLTLDAKEIPDGATAFKCCPPIRGRENADELWRALADGTITCVVSDHSPCTETLKEGSFGTAWGGISSLQLGLPVMWTEARRRGHELADVVRWMSAGPAELAGLTGRKGAITVGADADLVAFDPDAEFTVDTGNLLHRNPVTPYAGRTLRGVVTETWLRGTPAGQDPVGVLLRRDTR